MPEGDFWAVKFPKNFGFHRRPMPKLCLSYARRAFFERLLCQNRAYNVKNGGEMRQKSAISPPKFEIGR